MSKGVLPCWVFDGEPPTLKNDVLEKRKLLKEEALILKEKAIENEDHDSALKNSQKCVIITTEMLDDAKNLIQILGLPYIQVSLFD